MEMNAKTFLLIIAGVFTSDKRSISGKQLEYLKAQAFLAMKAEGIPFMDGDDEEELEDVQKSAELPDIGEKKSQATGFSKTLL